MKFRLLLILLIGMLATSAHADEIHPSEELNTALSSCLPGGVKEDNCLIETLLEYTIDKKLRASLTGGVNDFFKTIIGDNKIYAIHPVLSKKLGNFIVEENVIIELDNGGISLLRVTFSKTLGNWGIRNVNISSVKETMIEALGLLL